MQVREKAGQSLTEPITAAGFRTYLGLSDTTQDTLIGTMITAARKWLENHTGLSIISKYYEVEFDKDDGYPEASYSPENGAWGVSGWYKLPFSPVTSITSVEIGGTAVDYDERGLNEVEIYPYGVISTDADSDTVDVEFIAGASDERATMVLYRIVADYFDARKDNPASDVAGTVSWNTMRLVNQLSNNTSI